MRYRPLGRTGLDVSVISYGASPLGSVFRDVAEADGIRTVHTALDLGVNLFDCSPYYGLTKAETVLGKALRGIRRDRYILATKVGRYGPERFDFSAARVTASVDESLARLGVDHLDLIQCHDIEFVPLAQIWSETIPALQRLREQGKVRFIGVTGYPLPAFHQVMAHTRIDTVLSYCRYSINDTALAGSLMSMQTAGVGVISASPLSMGLLTDRGGPAWHPAPEALKTACAHAAAHCRTKGADLARLAVQFAVAEERIASTLVGTASPENIAKNVAWSDEPIDRVLLAEVQAILAPVQNMNWSSGLPENSAAAATA